MTEEDPTMEHHAAILRLTLEREGADAVDRYADLNNIERCICPSCGCVPWTGAYCMLCDMPVADPAPKLEAALKREPLEDEHGAVTWDISGWDRRSRLPCFGTDIARQVLRLGTLAFTPGERELLLETKRQGKDIHAAALDDIRCRYATAMLEAELFEDGEVFIEKATRAFGNTEGHWRDTVERLARERER